MPDGGPARDASLVIAGTHITVRCDGASVVPTVERSYEPFVPPPGGLSAASGIEVQLEPGPIPDTPGATLLCEAEQYWSMFRDGAGYALRLAIPALGRERDWLARFDRPVERVTVHCAAGLGRGERGATVESPVRYPLDQLLLMVHLASREGVLLHAAGAEIGGRGFLFVGRSGAGKSTVARLLEPAVERFLSDDRMIVRRIGGVFKAYGTPWPGEAEIAVNASAPVTALLFLKQASANEAVELSAGQACEALFPVASIPWYDPPLMAEVLGTCEELARTVPAFELRFTPTPAAAGVVLDLARSLEGSAR